MKYQLVVQWPAGSINDYDAMIEAENALIENLTDVHDVDGHDVGSSELNIFVLTNNVEKALDEVKATLEAKGFWTYARIAYREIGKSEYTVLWPKGLKVFHVA